MKILLTTFMMAAAGITVTAQDAPVTAAMPDVKARVVAELAATARQGAVKNSPMTADEVNESVQTLADGNRIVRSSTGKLYRNSEGRVRRELSGGTGGVMGTTFTFSPGVSILSPADGQKFLLDSQAKTARVVELAQASKGLAIEGLKVGAEANSRIAERLATELRAAGQGRTVVVTGDGAATVAPMPPMPPMPAMPPAALSPAIAPGAGQHGVFTYSTGESKYESRTEELGTRDFEGVSAEGTRRTTTIPAGAIGNERPIEIVYERWFSKELGLVVYSKNIDPRFGEQTYRLTNILRAEPDPSLFSVPTEYRKLDGTTVYKVSGLSRPAKPTAPARPVSAVHAKARP